MDENGKCRGEVALHFYSHVESQVGLATNKTGLLIAADAFLLAAYLTLVKDFAEKIPAGAVQIWYAVIGLAILLLIAATASSLWAVFPTRRPRTARPSQRNLVFFGHVASFGDGGEEYVGKFTKATAVELQEDLLRQAYGKSYYLNRMFLWLQFSVSLTIASLFVFAFAAVFALGSKAMG